MPYVHQDFEREKLYVEIWSEPVSKVSKRYQMSDVGLRKICLSLDVPVPPRGYWEKLAAGKAVKKPSLPPTKGATTYRRSVFRNPHDDELSLRTQVRIDEDVASAPDAPSISMRTSIDECVPLVKRMAKKLEGKQRDSRTWPNCEGAGLMRAAVSPQNSLRALLVLNMLIETLTGAGYSLSSGGKEDEPAYVTLLGSRLTFRVRERARQENIPLSREQLAENKRAGYNLHSQGYVYHPTNELEISAFSVGSTYAAATAADSRSAWWKRRCRRSLAGFGIWLYATLYKPRCGLNNGQPPLCKRPSAQGWRRFAERHLSNSNGSKNGPRSLSERIACGRSQTNSTSRS